MQFQYFAVALLSGLAIATPGLQQPEKRVDVVGGVTSAAGGAVSSALGGVTGGGSSGGSQETGASSDSAASSTASSSEASSTGSESSSATDSSSSATDSSSSSATDSAASSGESGATSTGGAGESGTSAGGAMRTAAPMAGILGAAGLALVFIVLQFEQNERSEVHFCSFLVPLSFTAEYFLFPPPLFAFLDLERGCYAADVDGAVVAADFAADAARAELVGDGGVAVDGEFDAAALAASFEFPVGVRSGKACS
ncbi:hypothetical protein V492_07923 [Pseudogymnoascus sp. VKM F-4246]|nr:hypothetical protein V492_07923 [Pseudogymnoascus sp. VKM F-4246]